LAATWQPVYPRAEALLDGFTGGFTDGQSNSELAFNRLDVAERHANRSTGVEAAPPFERADKSTNFGMQSPAQSNGPD
jgi:hypothetical protein